MQDELRRLEQEIGGEHGKQSSDAPKSGDSTTSEMLDPATDRANSQEKDNVYAQLRSWHVQLQVSYAVC